MWVCTSPLAIVLQMGPALTSPRASLWPGPLGVPIPQGVPTPQGVSWHPLLHSSLSKVRAPVLQPQSPGMPQSISSSSCFWGSLGAASLVPITGTSCTLIFQFKGPGIPPSAQPLVPNLGPGVLVLGTQGPCVKFSTDVGGTLLTSFQTDARRHLISGVCVSEGYLAGLLAQVQTVAPELG